MRQSSLYCLITLSLALTPFAAHADDMHYINFVNHTRHTITYEITYTKRALPRLPSTGKIEKGQVLSSEALKVNLYTAKRYGGLTMITFHEENHRHINQEMVFGINFYEGQSWLQRDLVDNMACDVNPKQDNPKTYTVTFTR